MSVVAAANVVVYFQPAPRAGGRHPRLPQLRATTEGQGVQHEDVREDVALQKPPCDARDVIEAALDRARLTKDEAARQMGITGTQLNRQLQNLDNQHVSFQRLWKLPNAFWRELLILAAQRRKLARARRRVVLDFEGV